MKKYTVLVSILLAVTACSYTPEEKLKATECKVVTERFTKVNTSGNGVNFIDFHTTNGTISDSIEISKSGKVTFEICNTPFGYQSTVLDFTFD